MTDTAADRARLAEYRDLLAYPTDLLRMAKDGIAAREALARALAEHEPEDVPESQHYYCDPDECDRAGEGVLVARCKTCRTVHPCATRRAITGEA